MVITIATARATTRIGVPYFPNVVLKPEDAGLDGAGASDTTVVAAMRSAEGNHRARSTTAVRRASSGHPTRLSTRVRVGKQWCACADSERRCRRTICSDMGGVCSRRVLSMAGALVASQGTD